MRSHKSHSRDSWELLNKIAIPCEQYEPTVSKVRVITFKLAAVTLDEAWPNCLLLARFDFMILLVDTVRIDANILRVKTKQMQNCSYDLVSQINFATNQRNIHLEYIHK